MSIKQHRQTLILGFLIAFLPLELSANVHLEPKGIEILDMSRPIDEHSVMVLSKGLRRDLSEGILVKTYRDYKGPFGNKKIPTGLLKVIESDDNTALATVIKNGTELSQRFFPKFPGIMVGDLGEISKPEIIRTVIVTPIVTLPYYKLFIDPMDSPHSFELTEAGKEMIKESLMKFADKRIKRLTIEGYTDDYGPSSVNQVESYQRALTIKQFAIDAMGIDPERLEVVGFGESNPVDSSFAPGYRKRNRRIVIKGL